MFPQLWESKYGKIMRANIGPYPRVLVTDPDAIAEIVNDPRFDLNCTTMVVKVQPCHLGLTTRAARSTG